MSSIKLVKAQEDEFQINFHNMLDRGTGYESTVTFKRNENYGTWTAEMTIGEMPAQDSPEDAADRMSQYLLALSKAVKGRNIKHLDISRMFKSMSKR